MRKVIKRILRGWKTKKIEKVGIQEEAVEGKMDNWSENVERRRKFLVSFCRKFYVKL